ncbi:hypothetical protein EYF80_047699 [Liparis tanakae]|uniref:Uncharacterized protein n=1 Tax=Liparis tanakae TaxID=230148 RepID=A0A4Z2FMN9_9TELE|nr:hypothetical protein EYF80_047699 [Liparis tanakae]
MKVKMMKMMKIMMIMMMMMMMIPLGYFRNGRYSAQEDESCSRLEVGPGVDDSSVIRSLSPRPLSPHQEAFG